MLTIDEMRTFLAVYDHGTHRVAAEVLNLPPSTISDHMSSLAAKRGCLFDRVKKVYRPNAHAHAFAAAVRVAVAAYDAAVAVPWHGEVGQDAASSPPSAPQLPSTPVVVREALAKVRVGRSNTRTAQAHASS